MKSKETAAEFMVRLNADPDYVARKNALDEEFRRREERARTEAPLVQELHSAGLAVDSVWDIVNSKVDGGLRANVLPILPKHLERPYPDAIRDGIAKVLSEVKNVRSLSYTRQLRDYATYAQQTGRQSDLDVRSNTRLSGSLLQEANAG